MTGRLTVLILGGYGTFGGRLAHLLADEARLTLIIAGRSRANAEKFCSSLKGAANVVPLVFDREGDVEAQLRTASPDLVVDASGPFQAYGDPYRVVRAAIACGIHYLDLADGADFVKGIAVFDVEAKRRGVFVLAGVSSFPVLTAAVVRKLSVGMSRVESVTGGIAPSPYAGVGLNVIRAIASYAGKSIAIGPGLRRHALTDTKRYTIAVPGRLPLNPLRFSLVDVPDIQVLPELWPELRCVWMGAAPVPEILHRAFNALAWLVRWRLIPSLSFMAPLMYRTINVLRWGEHRGGMFVEVEGVTANGERVQRSWHLIAEAGDGPLIPSMAAEAIVRHCLDGQTPPPGARPATRELEVADYEKLFKQRRIYIGTREPIPASAPLYRRVLGAAWDELPEPIRRMHDLDHEMIAEGRAEIDRGSGLIARLVAAMFGFPKAGRDIPVRVRFSTQGGREIWQRDFAGSVLSSIQEEGQGRFERLLCERFGPFAFGLALAVEDGRLKLIARRWSCLGVPMPAWLGPRGDAYESAENGRFNFHVEIGLPFVGLVVRYRGWLTAEMPAKAGRAMAEQARAK